MSTPGIILTKLAFTTDPASTYTADDTFGVVVTADDLL